MVDLRLAIIVLGFLPLVAADVTGQPLAAEPRPWEQLYTEADATGPQVVALWQFLPGREAQDGSGRGHALALRGEAQFVQQGPFGAALESFPADADHDKPQGALTPDADDLSPAGAFALEAWFCAKPEMDQHATVFVLDKKYFHYAKDLPEANTDYCLYLTRTGENRRRPVVSLGFGKDSDFISGPEIDVAPGRWIHLAYTYDGEGRSRFFLNGELLYKTIVPGRGPVTPGSYGLAIGCRYGSIHNGFPGYLAQVRICRGIVPYFTGGLVIGTSGGRTVFLRMEQEAAVPLSLTNDSSVPLVGGQAEVVLGDSRQAIDLPALGPNDEHAIAVAVDTSLRPGDYALSVTASALAGEKPLRATKEFPITIVPRALPHRMPVVMWGGGDIPTLKAIGFTHQLLSLVDEGLVWQARKPVPALSPPGIEEQARLLDDLLRNGLRGAVYTYPGTWVTRDEARRAQYNRVDRQGQPRSEENVCGNFPEVRELCTNVGASLAQTFGQFPALDGALIHSEVRDGSDLCFHEHDREAFRAFAGYDIPPEAEGKNGLHYSRLKDFPPDRVIPDDEPLLTFYRWFWKNGDGWNVLHSEVSRGLKSTGRSDLWTFFDPAVRVPDVWGSGGEVDVISQWTYSYPDPIKIGQATDELFAMAEGNPGQQVMKMTQIIWYRSGTAPNLPENETKRAQWERDKPEAPFITIAPDHLREAFWSKISRPVRGIMYHGWGSLVETGTTNKGYVFTDPGSAKVLTELTHNVVQPLGPTLLQVPDRSSDVAVLESFASQMLAGRGSYGWSQSREADMHLVLQWAHLQPKVVFDETVVRDGLDDYRVLVMPCCDVLTESVAAKIRAFQRRGGIVVADEFLCPAILPDIVLPTYTRTGKAEEDKAALQAQAAALRKELDPFYTRHGDSTDPDVVLRFRQYSASDYLFVLNDKRTFGDYVGHHGKVMEKGLPAAATVSVLRKGSFVYDLVKRQSVPAKTVGDRLEFDVNLGPGDGTVFLLTDRRIGGVRVETPRRVRLGGAAEVTISVVDTKGAALDAVVPVQVEILDPQGRPAEYSGYYGAKDGSASLRLDLAPNDAPGAWSVRATELASGLSRSERLTVLP